MAPDSVLLQQFIQGTTMDIVKCFLLINRAHLDQWGELPKTLKQPAEDIELVEDLTARMKTTLLLLNPRFNNEPRSPLQ